MGMAMEKTSTIVLATRSTLAGGLIGTVLGAEGLEAEDVTSPEELRRMLEDAGDAEAAREKVFVVDVELFVREPIEAARSSWRRVFEEPAT